MRATIFDFNGVLVDDEAVHLAAFRDVLAPRGIALGDADYAEKYLGFDDAGAFRAILADHGHAADAVAVAGLIEAKKPCYMRRVEGALVVFPGAAELIARRAARGRVAIVSGALRHEIEHALGAMGAKVELVVSAEDTARCKPDPEGYVLALAKLGILPHEGVVVEDSIAGVESAKAAGLRCVAVTHSYARERLVAAGADAVVDSLLALDDATLDGA